MARHEPVVSSGQGDNGGDTNSETGDKPTADAARKPLFSRVGTGPLGLAVEGIVLTVLGVGMFVFLAAMGEPLVGIWFMVPTMASGVTLYMLSVRRRLRDGIVKSLAKVVADHLMLQSTADVEVHARRWRRGWIGVPTLISVRYGLDANLAAGGGAVGLAAVVEKELGRPIVVGRDHQARGRMTLRDSEASPRRMGLTSPAEAQASLSTRRKHLPAKVDRPVPPEEPTGDWMVPLGVDVSGTTTVWNMQAAQGHVLVLGRGGSGKRVLLTGMVIEVVLRGWPVWVIDHHRVELLGLRDWPNVQIVASSLDDQIVVLNQAWREMERRIGAIESGSSPRELEPLVLVIHHYRDFVTAVSEAAERAEQGRTAASLASDRVNDILRHGSQVNVFVVLSVQGGADSLLDAKYREKLGTIVALGRIDDGTAAKLWRENDRSLSAEPIPGRAVVQVGDAVPVPIQCYWTPDPLEAARNAGEDQQDRYLLAALRPNLANHVALNVQRPVAVGGSPAAAWKANMTAELTEGFTPSGHVLSDWHRDNQQDASVMGGSGEVHTSTRSEIIMVSQLEPGHLVRLEEADGWVIVEEVDPVEDDTTRLRILWRGSDGAGSVEVSRTRTVRIRHMSDGNH